MSIAETMGLAHEAHERLCRIEELLADIRDNTLQDVSPPIRRQRIPFTFTADANGNGDQTILVPQGWQWALLRFSCQIPFVGAGQGYIAFYREAEDPRLLLAVSSAGTIFTDTFAAEGDIVPGQSRVVVVARGIVAGLQVAGNIAVRATQDTDPTTIY